MEIWWYGLSLCSYHLFLNNLLIYRAPIHAGAGRACECTTATAQVKSELGDARARLANLSIDVDEM